MTISRSTVFFIWIAILSTLLYLYFFHPAIFNQIFYYPGAGSPYVNTPSGGGG